MAFVSDDFSFDVIYGRDAENRPTTIARFECDRCPAAHEEVLKGGSTINPEHIAKRACRAGWDAPARRGKPRCPACSSKRQRGESPGPKTLNNPESNVVNLPTNPTTPKAKPAVEAMADLTPGQKQQIRTLLDKHFDDSAGAYLDGYSDQRIGAELNLAWAHVSRLREVGYGPIRRDMEVDTLRAELRQAEDNAIAAVQKLAKSLEVSTSAFTAIASSIGSKIDALEKRRSAA